MTDRIAGARPLFPEEDLPGVLSEIGEVLRVGRLILGERTRAVEAAWAERVGTQHAVAVSSCTAALSIAYRAAAVAGREVIVPTNTFVATTTAALNAGAKVVFADTDGEDFGIHAEDALAKINDRTAAVVVVHIAGIPSRATPRLVEACRARGIPLIEDCAHAHGARLGGKGVGAIGAIGCWSFYPTKILTCGTGGFVTTDDERVASLARSLRHHGQGVSLEDIVEPGDDWLLDEVRAVLALAQVRRLDDFVARRRAIAARYAELLGNDQRVTLPRPAADAEPTWYKYPILLAEGVDREGVRRVLAEEHGIETGAIYSPPCHLMPVFRKTLGTGPGMLPRAEALLHRQLCLPMHGAVTAADVERSVAALDRVLERS